MARSMLSPGMFSALAASMAVRSRALPPGSPPPVDVIVQWYGEVLPLNKWTIKTTSRDRAGTVSIYAERDARPLWITLRPNLGDGGTTYRLVGVFNIDSTKADSIKK